MGSLRRIPTLNDANIDKSINLIDENFKKLDNRRLKQITQVSAGATDAESITNLITKLNELIDSLNSSDLTV